MSAIRDLGRPDVRWQRVYPAWDMGTLNALKERKDELWAVARLAILRYQEERDGPFAVLGEVRATEAAEATLQWMEAHDAYMLYLREGDR